jgi:myosin heavy subunit
LKDLGRPKSGQFQLIWVPDDKQAWAPAKVVSVHKGKKKSENYLKVIINPMSGDGGKEKKVEGLLEDFEYTSMDELSMEVENLANLNSFNEGLILHHVKQRFSRGTIYTSVGNILVAVNPYRSLPIYEKDLMHSIWNQMKSDTSLGDVPPHVFAIGGQALCRITRDFTNQSILISGESGAGKTETTKRILEFISNAAPSRASADSDVPIETQILESNPILESFGNSKTLRNNNSSRFGKFMRVNFDTSSQIRGCSIDTYLLEKVRVVKQLENERSYHVFYMMLAGAGKDMKTDFGLNGKEADDMNYLNSSGCVKVSGRNEKKMYVEMVEAFDKLDFPVDMVKYVFQLLAAILHLGNVFFEDDSATDGSRIVGGNDGVALVAKLLHITDLPAFVSALCYKDLEIRGDVTKVALKASQAMDQRDAVAKTIYHQVFEALVKQINSSLSKGDRAKQDADRMIGILDIFGFEVFQTNSFEQLCINYCNERLQTFFNEVIFKDELAIYEEEGVDCSGIKYQDNLECVRVIDGTRNTGIFSFLDEECVVPQGSDEKLLKKMDTAFSSKSGAAYSKYYQQSRKLPNTFIVGHFAGDVVYNVLGFMEKNKDTLHGSMAKIIESSDIEMLKPEVVPPTPAQQAGRGGAGKNNKITVSTKFKKNLDDLMNSLESTTPSFVRCIKPNEVQKADKWDAKLVLRQMKYSGLFEAIKIRRSGFSVRFKYKHFVNRYKCIIPMDRWASLGLTKSLKASTPPDEVREMVNSMLEALQAPDLIGDAIVNVPDKPNSAFVGIKWAVGNSRVFFRTAAQSEALEQFLQNNVLPDMILKLQRCVRTWLRRGRENRAFNKVVRAREADEKIRKAEADLFSMEDVMSQAEEMLYRAEIIKQRELLEAKRLRLIEEEQKNKALRISSAVLIQARIRGFLARTMVRVYFCEMMFEKALKTRSEPLLRDALHKTAFLNVHSPALHLYQRHAKQLIMEVLSESYIANQIKEAIASESKFLIEEALKAAKESRMMFLPEVSEGLRALEEHKKRRQTLTWLNTELQRASTVPRLIESVDYINLLLQQAARRGLHHDPVCRTAIVRMGKVKNLLAVRNKMRFHVETGSLSGMKAAVEEREPLVKLFGEELFQEELRAINEMRRMIKYMPLMNESLDATADMSSPRKGKKDGDGGDDIDEDEEMDKFDQKGMLETKAPAQADKDKVDILLPAWVRRLLILQRQFIVEDKEEELRQVEYRFYKMVPDPALRKHYLRIFKWNVAFCSWMPSHPRNVRRKGIRSALHIDDEEKEKDLAAEEEERLEEEKRMSEAGALLKQMKEGENEDGSVGGDDGSTASPGKEDGRKNNKDGASPEAKDTGPKISTGTAAGTDYRKLGKKGPLDKYGRQVDQLHKYQALHRGGGPGKAFAGRKLKEGEMSASDKAAHIRKAKNHHTTSAFQMATGPYSKRRAKSDITRMETFERGMKIKRKPASSVDDRLADQAHNMALGEHKLMQNLRSLTRR